MPTTEIKTIKPGGGGDYTTLNAWYAAEVTNLVTADKIKVAEVYSGGNCLSGQLQMTGWTTDATRYVIIRPASGEGHVGIYDETKAYGSVSGSNQAAIENRANFTRIIGMQLKTTGISVSPAVHQQSQCQGTLVDKCILVCTSTTDSCLRISGGGSPSPHVCRNSVLLATSSSSVVSVIGVISVGVLTLYNNTIIGGTGALSSVNGGTITSDNNYLKATTIYGGATYVDRSNDATSNTEASNASLDNVAYSTANFVNVTAGSEDLHIVEGSVLVDNGADLSGSGVTEDFTGQARTAPFDIGADELDPPGGASAGTVLFVLT